MNIHVEAADQPVCDHIGIAEVVAGINPDGRHRRVDLSHEVQHGRGVAPHAGGRNRALLQTQRPGHDVPCTGITQRFIQIVNIQIHEE